MSVSLCMISKNEEDFIGRSLDSVNKFVDEIIVVDTGSTDKTIDIALSYNAKVINSLWQKDFSYHRNEAINKATCDWILFLDCDEIIENKNLREVINILEAKNNQCRGYNLKITNIVSEIEVASFMAVRLFKNFEGFSFTGKIHEQIIDSIISKYGLESIQSLPLTIKHYGYDELVIKKKNKIERNLDILLHIQEKNEYIYAMIGDEYLKSNNLERAVIYYEHSLTLNNQLTSDYSHTLIVNYISALINLRVYPKALEFINYSKLKLPYFRDLYFLEFWILLYSKHYKEALVKLDEYERFDILHENYLELKNFGNLYNLKIIRYEILQELSK